MNTTGNILRLSALGLSTLGMTHYAEAQKQPNIMVIMTDDMGYSDIGCYGGVLNTPNLDKLAANGLQYMQFYNTARSCPSRASLLTGLHPHQAGIGHMTNNRGEDGYRGELNNHCMTFGEVLQPAGYETYAVGKWHVALNLKPDGAKHNWPLQRGFQHFYGTIQGGGSFYDPTTLCRDNQFVTVENDPLYKPENFYYTNAIGDNACMFLDEHKAERDGKPFFMYVTFTAAHWPMQAPESDIALYKGKFDKGWDKIRQEKYKEMIRRGIIKPQWALSEDPSVPKWNSVNNKEFEARCMEVYAAMVDIMDRNVGKIVEHLKRNGQFDNTVIFYLQDNGGCAEPLSRGREPHNLKIPKGQNMDPMTADELQTQLIPFKTRDGRRVWMGQVMPGSADTYIAYGKAWAWVSNTPFREYKHWVHEGGISTPLIVHWSKGIKKSGEQRLIPSQLPDIMATCIELSGAKYPATYKGTEIYPYEGKSLVASFRKDNPKDKRPLFWEHEGNRAIRSGDWKLVYKAKRNMEQEIPLSAWELYNMSDDRTEIHNLADKYPDKVAELAAQWDDFATRCHVRPWPHPFK